MTNEQFNMEKYLERIKFNGEPDNSLETLKELHRQHVFNIPFENFNPYLGRPVLLDIDSLYKKIVLDKRGGYCFEMNGLFGFVLRKLGFEVTDLLARVFRGEDVYGPQSHQVMKVDVDGASWIADVGFGGNALIEPIMLEDGVISRQFNRNYRLLSDPRKGFILQFELEEGKFQSQYFFKLDECVIPDDYLAANYFTSTFPGSFFTTIRTATMPTEEGRITLFNDNLKIISNGNVEEKAITDKNEYNKILKEYFGIEL